MKLILFRRHIQRTKTNIFSINVTKIIRTISSIKSTAAERRVGIDSHVDMNCAGSHVLKHVLEEDITRTVQPFNDTKAPSTKGRAVYAQYDNDTPCGCIFILQVNHFLYFAKTMKNSILCINQA